MPAESLPWRQVVLSVYRRTPQNAPLPNLEVRNQKLEVRNRLAPNLDEFVNTFPNLIAFGLKRVARFLGEIPEILCKSQLNADLIRGSHGNYEKAFEIVGGTLPSVTLGNICWNRCCCASQLRAQFSSLEDWELLRDAVNFQRQFITTLKNAQITVTRNRFCSLALQPLTSQFEPLEFHSFGDKLEPRWIVGA